MSYIRSPRRQASRMQGPGAYRITEVRESRNQSTEHVRYAVVGLGHIAQVAVLPAFRNARGNSKLVALFSDDATKRRELAAKYRVPLVSSYKDYESYLKKGGIDAVYIALPNSMHCNFAVRAARHGVHVLCEKPLAVTTQECRTIIDACRKHRVKLMTAYRLHFEKANLEAIKIAQSGKIGNPRYFNSIFSMQVSGPNIRLDRELGGGVLYDIGIYCINAARYLFRDEPTEVLAMTEFGTDGRFREVEEMSGALLRFPQRRLASFTCSFGAADAANYDITGTKGIVRLENAYEYAMPIEMRVTIAGSTQRREFSRRDQFAPELIYFSDCILRNREPEPSGLEGLLDVRVIEALYRSAKTSKPVKLPRVTKQKRPSLKQEKRRPPVRQPKMVHAKSASS